jgi:hypothetical protein
MCKHSNTKEYQGIIGYYNMVYWRITKILKF